MQFLDNHNYLERWAMSINRDYVAGGLDDH